MRNRLSWDDFNMMQAFFASTKSPDENTQHGSYIVDKENRPISMGYNGFPRGCDDSKMPQTRPAKYRAVIHAETNAIYNARANLTGSTLYVTGYPCSNCWGGIIQNGIVRVVYGPIKSTAPDSVHLQDNPDAELINLMLQNQNISVEKWEPKNLCLIKDSLRDLLKKISKTGRG